MPMPMVPRMPALPRATGCRTRPAQPHREIILEEADADFARAPSTADPSPPPSPSRATRSDSKERSADRVGSTDFVEIDPNELVFCESVGAGASAEVFRGYWKKGEVAIKEIFFSRKKDTKAELKQQVAFMREIAVLSKVEHENLVRFMGVSLASRQMRIVTEFCRGNSLFGLLHDDTDVELVWPQKLKMMKDIAQAMNYLHAFRPQIIHRDLKSLNLLLREAVRSPRDVPSVKVSDFGLARMKDAGASNHEEWTKMTKEAGTGHWMAPEVPSGEYDEKADVYSYAIVLFEIMCREIPFEEAEGAEAVRLSMTGARPEIEALPPDRPDALEFLMTSCWAMRPHHRPSFVQICTLLDNVRLR